MRFVVDEQLPRRLAELIEQLGHQADHVLDLGLRMASDPTIRAYAARLGAVVVSKDDDHFQAVIADSREPALVYVLLGNCGNNLLLARATAEWPGFVQRLTAGARVVELR